MIQTFADSKDKEGFHLLVVYSKPSHEFDVTVTSPKGEVKTEAFRANFEPVFGMDILDWQIAEGIAEKLAVSMGATPHVDKSN